MHSYNAHSCNFSHPNPEPYLPPENPGPVPNMSVSLEFKVWQWLWRVKKRDHGWLAAVGRNGGRRLRQGTGQTMSRDRGRRRVIAGRRWGQGDGGWPTGTGPSRRASDRCVGGGCIDGCRTAVRRRWLTAGAAPAFIKYCRVAMGTPTQHQQPRRRQWRRRWRSTSDAQLSASPATFVCVWHLRALADQYAWSTIVLTARYFQTPLLNNFIHLERGSTKYYKQKQDRIEKRRSIWRGINCQEAHSKA